MDITDRVQNLRNHLTPQVTWYIGYVYPAAITLPDELGEANLTRLLHLLDELEQAAVVGSVTSDDVSRAAEHVMAVLHTPDERVEFLAAIARGHHNGLSPRFAYRVQ